MERLGTILALLFLSSCTIVDEVKKIIGMEVTVLKHNGRTKLIYDSYSDTTCSLSGPYIVSIRYDPGYPNRYSIQSKATADVIEKTKLYTKQSVSPRSKLTSEKVIKKNLVIKIGLRGEFSYSAIEVSQGTEYSILKDVVEQNCKKRATLF
ncbi:hypothetical protein SAMN06296036_1053 [Pseudobacteriovorax antillogorgiicola]|uniref:Lipoprotein n=1 Tax=Pseudobacteriovorax antillogorgiicola TaxID=1513793 RepID=A0A1Y6BGW2_9BACT|nr:hypothetical protein EDD56_105321 [Pseudobacteriovorax antillogorgiicola]SMF10464.1 hypothetical protein SAMN06296036_1053 [Pseudobacteriovorax antillogorgiicola]